jgi:N-acetylglucosamine kinase-like BadF-type ATPase
MTPAPLSHNLAVVGVDGGGTKTAGLLLDLHGRVLAQSRAGTSNYQICGAEAAEAEIGGALEPLRQHAARQGLRVAALGFGLSGWDRPTDHRVITDLLDRLAADTPYFVDNDLYLALRAGTVDGVGVGVVSGTGGNCGGTARDGSKHRVGGLLSELGDGGGAGDIAVAATRASRRGKDGRGPHTRLEELIVAHFGLQEIEDVADFFIPGLGRNGSLPEVCPLVFEAAREGDRVARRILEEAGEELGLCARITACHLFRPEEAFPLVMGGSVLQKGDHPIMREALVSEVRKLFRHVEVHLLDCPPVLGAAFYALDLLHDRGELPEGFTWPDAAYQAQVRAAVLAELQEGDDQ